MEVILNNIKYKFNLVNSVTRDVTRRGFWYDHLKDDGTYFKRYSTYTKDNYNLEPHEYLGLVISGDTTYRGKCNNCGLSTKLNNEQNGFRPTCSKSCHGKYSSEVRISNGTHSWQSGNFDENIRLQQRLKANDKTRQMIKDGTHPFYNLSKESKSKAAITTARIKSRKGICGTQNIDLHIRTMFTQGLNSCKHRNLSTIYLYYSIVDNNYIKIGWTSDLIMRENDGRRRKFDNLILIKSGSPIDILTLEKDIKLKYQDPNIRKLFKSTEIFDIKHLNEILTSIN